LSAERESEGKKGEEGGRMSEKSAHMFSVVRKRRGEGRRKREGKGEKLGREGERGGICSISTSTSTVRK